jgi:hypothetical protein
MNYKHCNLNFQSQFAYLDNQVITITNYLNNTVIQKQTYCSNKHELVAVRSKKKKCHFRHKHTSDLTGEPMTEWHSEWQGNFPITEQWFSKISHLQVSNRRADVVLNDFTIVEIQNSPISTGEILARKNDYQLHGKEIKWIINGNEDIAVKKLDNSQRVLLHFKGEQWKHESFSHYDFVYLDINSEIYKFKPSFVKGKMIDVELSQPKDLFIKSLLEGKNLWTDIIPPQCNLYVQQQGAGNGKTYEIIQRLQDPSFSHFNTFIFVTKQHSAKDVIYGEFKNQYSRNLLADIDDVDTISKDTDKKRILKIHRKSDDKYIDIVISTIDSLLYSIGKSDSSSFDAFTGLIDSIIKNNTKINLSGNIKFANATRELNKNTLLIIDETQDLDQSYAEAIIAIQRNTYIDCMVVGDKLQSLRFEKNAFTYFSEKENDDSFGPFINRIKKDPTNICNRFNHRELLDFVNCMVPFEKYDLPKVTVKAVNTSTEEAIFFIKDDLEVADDDDSNSTDSNLSQKKSKSTFIRLIDVIISRMDNEVSKYDRKPNDFLIITPFSKSNPFVDLLTTRIQMYWQKKTLNDMNYVNNVLLKDTLNGARWSDIIQSGEYFQWVVFHKSEEGTSINLLDSEISTRVVSCHSSKGDGRKVVFLQGFTESTVRRFSNKTDSLIFDSMIHVAYTRMKEKLYILYKPNGDKLHHFYYDFSMKANRQIDIEPVIELPKPEIKIDKLLSSEKEWDSFYEKIISKADIPFLDEKQDDKKVIDMGHHTLRYMCMLIGVTIEIIKKENHSSDIQRRHQIKKIFTGAAEATIEQAISFNKYYELLLGIDYRRANKKKKSIPILKLSKTNKRIETYYDIIRNSISRIQKYIKKNIDEKTFHTLCPFECIILFYMISVSDNGIYSEINIHDLYNIVDIYSKSFSHKIDGHEHCGCKENFEDNSNINSDNVQKYIFSHYEKMKILGNLVSKIYEKNPYIAWSYLPFLQFDGYKCEGSDCDFRLSSKLTLVSYDNNNVNITYLKPQLNSINRNDTIMTSVLDTFMMQNFQIIEKDGKQTTNCANFYNRKISITIITLDSDDVITYSFDNEGQNLIKSEKQFILDRIFHCWSQIYEESHSTLYAYYNDERSLANKEKIKTSIFVKTFKKKLEDKVRLNLGAPYIKQFFGSCMGLDDESASSKDLKKKLIKFENKEQFMKIINKLCRASLSKYLKISIDKENDLSNDSDSDSDSD